MVSGFSLPLLYAILQVIISITSKRFSDDLFFTKKLKVRSYKKISPFGFAGLSFQIVSCVTAQSFIQYFFIEDKSIFYSFYFFISDILIESILIHLNSLLFYFLVHSTLKTISWIWNFVTRKFAKKYNDEYDNCWSFQAQSDFSIAEFFEFLHILVGLTTILLFIYYCGNASNLYTDIYKWIDFLTYHP